MVNNKDNQKKYVQRARLERQSQKQNGYSMLLIWGSIMTNKLQRSGPYHVVVVVVHIYLTVTRQRRTLTVGRSAHFSLQWLRRGWRNSHLLRSFQLLNVPMNFFEFLSAEVAACSKPPSRDNHCKANYPRTQQRDQDAGWPRSCVVRANIYLGNPRVLDQWFNHRDAVIF